MEIIRSPHPYAPPTEGNVRIMREREDTTFALLTEGSVWIMRNVVVSSLFNCSKNENF
ncbi:MAG: hypothetical protein LBP62_04010 [Clostridiales bacterium]|jgi:hypothetical protein|nr:hypothetical protein [Clostridiales bacterium]